MLKKNWDNAKSLHRGLPMGIRMMFLSVLVTLISPSLTAATNGQNQDSSTPDTDYIYLKETGKDELGFVKVPGMIEGVTRDYVLFKKAGTEPVRLYTKEEVRRIEMGSGNSELKKIVNQHWNDQQINFSKKKWDELILEVVTQILPRGIFVSLLVLAGLYLIVTTLLQAYNRFVIESSIRKLNVEKLLGEIKKNHAEILKLRNDLGAPISKEELNSLIRAVEPEEKVEAGDKVMARAPAGVSGIRLSEFQGAEALVFKFIKQILGVPTQEKFESRKQALVNKWQNQSPGWFNFLNAFYSTIYYMLMINGWLFVLGGVSTIILIITEPESQTEFSNGSGFGFVFTVFTVGVVIGLERLRQNRKIRKAAYREVGNPDPAPQAGLQKPTSSETV